MRDLTDQLRGYRDSLAATVEPVTAAEAMTTEAPPSPEARDRRARRHWRMVAAAAAVLLVLVGWSAFSGSSGPMRWLAGDDADALRGRAFEAVSMTEGGGAPEPAVGSLAFGVDFVDLYDGCNTMNAPFSVERGRLVVGPGVSTAMNCGQDGTGPERWARVLASAGVALDGDRLTLSDDTITVELVDRHASPPPATVVGSSPTTVALAHTPTLEELDGRSFLSASVREEGLEKVLAPNPFQPDGSAAHLSFEVHDGVLLLEAGCNEMRTALTIADGRIRVAANHTTEVDCGEALLAQDAWFYAFMASSPEIRIAGSALTLTGGTTVIEFIEAPPEPVPSATTPGADDSSPTSPPPPTIDSTATTTVPADGNAALPPLVGTTWELIRIDRGPKVTDPVDPRITTPIDVPSSGLPLPTLRFTSEANARSAGGIAGTNGCYQFTGGYSSPTGASLSFAAVSLPLEGCEPQARAIAIAFDAALHDQEHPFAYSIDASGLRLESETWRLELRAA